MVNKLSLPATDNEVQTKVNEVVDDINTNVVHKTGNEKITGTKTFEGNSRIVVLRNSTVTYNTAPSSDTFTDLSFRDKNSDEMAVLEHVRYSNNNSAFRLMVKGVDGNWSTSLEVGKKADGTTYTSAPTPTTSDNSDKIATTAFVKSQGYITSSALTDKADTDLSNINNSGKILVSGLSMPSSKYDDLTLGVSGATYSAPANGWFVFARASSANNQFNSIINVSAGGLRCDSYATSSGKWATVFMPAKKGDTIQVEYNTSTDKLFRFIYAEGENV